MFAGNDQQQQEDVEMKSKSSIRSGRRPIPIRWTRVVSLDKLESNEVETYPVEDDMLDEYRLPNQLSKKRKAKWQPVFDPKEFWRSRDEHELDKYKLTDRQLKAAAKRVTDMRELILRRAEDLVKKDQEAMVDGLAVSAKEGKKIRNRGSTRHRDPNEIKPSEYMETPPGSHRHRSRTKSKIELSERIKIVHEVVCQLKPLKQVAKEHRVTPSWISSIVTKSRKNPNLLRERSCQAEEATT